MNISKSNHQFCMVILTWEALLPCTSRILHSALVGLPHGSQLHRLNLSLFIFLHVLGGCGKKKHWSNLGIEEEENHFLRVIPSLKHFSDIVSDMPSGSIHGIYLFWHSIWHSFWHILWHSIWHSVWHIFWHTFLHMFWHLFWHSFWHLFWHSLRHSILAFYLASIRTLAYVSMFIVIQKKIEQQFATNLVGFYQFLSFFWGRGPGARLPRPNLDVAAWLREVPRRQIVGIVGAPCPNGVRSVGA